MKTQFKKATVILKESEGRGPCNMAALLGKSVFLQGQEARVEFKNLLRDAIIGQEIRVGQKEFAEALLEMPALTSIYPSEKKLIMAYRSNMITLDDSFLVERQILGSWMKEVKFHKKNYVGEIHGEEILLMNKFLGYIAGGDMRPAMNAVYYDSDKMVASDAHVLIWKRDIPKINAFIMFLPQVVKLLNLFPGRYKIFATEYRSSPTHTPSPVYWLEGERINITFRGIDSNYPTWESVVPQEHKFNVYFDRREMLKATKFLKHYASQGSQLLKMEFGLNRIGLTVSDLDFNHKGNIDVYAENHGKVPNIGVKLPFLEKVLKDLDSDLAHMKITDETKALVFNDQILLMPMMINT